MNIFIKWCLVLMLSIGSLYSQATKILSLDSIDQLDPVIMNDTTHFRVVISVNDTSVTNNDSTSGYLFYYYLTDSMIDAGTPPRIIAPNPDTISIHPFFTDTVPVDIRPDEIRTEPVNLIILWPGLINYNLDIADTDSVVIEVIVEGFLNNPYYPVKQEQLFYPVPVMQILYIRPEELSFIHTINLLTMNGDIIRGYGKQDIASGYIYLTDLPTGSYVIETTYENGKVTRKKIVKD